jgi:hypothetical protein
MRSKLILAVLALLTLPALSQVGPTVTVGGLPIGIGVGFVGADTDYYRPFLPPYNGRMYGGSAWVNYPLFHHIGVEAEGTTIFANQPTAKAPTGEILYGKLKEETLQGGFIYKFHERHQIHPYLKAMGGVAKVNFPYDDPLYTAENAGVASGSAGIEYRAFRNIFVRGQYQYQWWKGFRQSSGFNPQSVTVGATYYLRGTHRHY